MLHVYLDHNEGWMPKNWTLNCGAGEDSWEPLGQQEYQIVNSKGNQPWIFIGRTDSKAEAPILWPPDVKNWLLGQDPDAGKDWRQEEKRTTEDEMVGWHHRLDGHEFEQAPGDGEEQGSLVCCSPWGPKSQTQLSDSTMCLSDTCWTNVRNKSYLWQKLSSSGQRQSNETVGVLYLLGKERKQQWPV